MEVKFSFKCNLICINWSNHFKYSWNLLCIAEDFHTIQLNNFTLRYRHQNNSWTFSGRLGGYLVKCTRQSPSWLVRLPFRSIWQLLWLLWDLAIHIIKYFVCLFLFCLLTMIYYNERIQNKTGQGKRHLVSSVRRPEPGLQDPLPCRHQSVLRVCEFISVLFVHLFCFLNSTCKWNHVFVFFCLPYFT